MVVFIEPKLIDSVNVLTNSHTLSDVTLILFFMFRLLRWKCSAPGCSRDQLCSEGQ